MHTAIKIKSKRKTLLDLCYYSDFRMITLLLIYVTKSFYIRFLKNNKAK